MKRKRGDMKKQTADRLRRTRETYRQRAEHEQSMAKHAKCEASRMRYAHNAEMYLGWAVNIELMLKESEIAAIKAERDRLKSLVARLLPYAENDPTEPCGRCGHPDATCDVNCAAFATTLVLVAEAHKVLESKESEAG